MYVGKDITENAGDSATEGATGERKEPKRGAVIIETEAFYVVRVQDRHTGMSTLPHRGTQ